MAFLD